MDWRRWKPTDRTLRSIAVSLWVRIASSDGSEAIANMSTPVDVSMPIMDGLEASRLIRAFEQQQKLTPVLIIALTGLGSSSAQDDAFASGVNLFLTKPVRLKELGRVLESHAM